MLLNAQPATNTRRVYGLLNLFLFGGACKSVKEGIFFLAQVVPVNGQASLHIYKSGENLAERALPVVAQLLANLEALEERG